MCGLFGKATKAIELIATVNSTENCLCVFCLDDFVQGAICTQLHTYIYICIRSTRWMQSKGTNVGLCRT